MPMVSPLLSALRLALRQLRRSRSFALTAVLTLALGVGANVVVFGVLDALLLRKLPVPTIGRDVFRERIQVAFNLLGSRQETDNKAR